MLEESAFDANWSESLVGSVRKWIYPYLRAFTLKCHNYDILHCPGIVFLDIQKKSKKNIGILISLKCFVPA